ncbi:hypothetical protein [Chitinophaga polysaccharea]|uniref:hypothetical protein n=1 Tax=Chitinophaga polysaccharea TaxID=1293035 RepID=UPI00115A4695|nr:hypothetical protein [Chitinophaga polysaccharea]
MEGFPANEYFVLSKAPRFAKTRRHTYNGQAYTLRHNDDHYLFLIVPKLIQMNPEREPNERK